MLKDPNFKRKVLKAFFTIFTVSLVVLMFYPFTIKVSEARVIETVDGDTLEIEHGQKTRSLRLKNVDTPETKGYNTPEEFKGVSKQNWRCLEKWGYRAKDFVSSKVEGETIKIRYRRSVFNVEEGRYGRMLGEVYLKGSNKTLGETLVEKGFARSYTDRYIEQEKKARNLSVGLWSCG